MGVLNVKKGDRNKETETLNYFIEKLLWRRQPTKTYNHDKDKDGHNWNNNIKLVKIK